MDWDFCSEINQIIALQLSSNNVQNAYNNALQVIPRIEKIDDWQGVGFGRFFIEYCMDIIAAEHPESNSLWQSACPHVKKMSKNMHWNLYEKAAKAAEKMEDDVLSRKLLKRLECERTKKN